MSKKRYIPTYDEAKELCSYPNSPFYESKLNVDGYNISVFNYRLSQWKDFNQPISGRKIDGYEMRGLTFVFNNDGTLFNRYLLLTKFFNLNQTPESMYSRVNGLYLKEIQVKEDGSIISFVRLPNGQIYGRSKMGFTNDQANAANRIYNTNSKLKEFVDWSLKNDLVPIFEYVSPQNRIVVKYSKDELVLTKIRNNFTGEYLDINEMVKEFPSVKVVNSIRGLTLDDLIIKSESDVQIEGWILNFLDEYNGDFFIKIKTDWYNSLHGLLTEDIHREHIIIDFILEDKIDDILGQIPQDEKETRERINKIINIVKYSINEKKIEIEKSYNDFLVSGLSRKEYAIKNRIGNPNFASVMNMIKGDDLKKLSEKEILSIYDDMDEYEMVLKRCDSYEIAKNWLRESSKKLNLAREFLKEKDPTLYFQDISLEE